MVIESSFFKENRDRFVQGLKDDSAAFIFAGEEKPMSADNSYRFHPDRNFYYLTGLALAGLVLVAVKHGEESVFTLYAPEHDGLKERWTGKRMDFARLSELSGLTVDNIRDLDTFEDDAIGYARESGLSVFVDGTSIMDAPRRFTEKVKTFGKCTEDISQVLVSLRITKRAPEIEAVRRAAAITEEALAETKKIIRPGVSEYEIYTRLEYEMARRGNMLFAFQTIVSCGRNAFYLHHSDPEYDGDGIAQEGSFIQIDVGAREAGYCADISRVYFVGAPENGDRRLELLELIRTLRREAFGFIAPGRTFDDLNSQMYDICGKWLAKQGFIPDNFSVDDVRSYYWHNTSHYLGLDVHDVGGRSGAFAAGCCLAVEPGVYIPEWSIGFRIEDDVLVTPDGCELLSSGRDDLEGIIAL